MKYSKFFYSVLFVGLIGCVSDILSGGYESLGTYDTRVEAQNKAINRVLERYESLPENEYYKVVYSFRDNAPNRRSKNSLWYNRGTRKLALEVDVNSGISCSWQEVSKNILEQASKAGDGMIKIDSLSNRDQPVSQCL